MIPQITSIPPLFKAVQFKDVSDKAKISISFAVYKAYIAFDLRPVFPKKFLAALINSQLYANL